MRVFVTGASGWIGRGLVPDLIAAGHEVIGLARSESTAGTLRAAGVQVRRGSIDDLDLLHDAAASSDGVVHLAFKHDIAFSGDFAGAAEADRRAIEAVGEALAGSGKPLVIASGILGVLGLPPGVVATERDGRASAIDEGKLPMSGGKGRMASADYALALAGRNVRSSVVRLPPATHGKGDNGFMAVAIRCASEKAAAVYVGDGSNRWPSVHRDDAARLFRLALESAPAGSVLHAVGEEGVPIRKVAEVFSASLGVPTLSISPAQAKEYLGFLGGFWGFDGPASAQLTRDLLGWRPAHAGLIADLEAGHYFR